MTRDDSRANEIEGQTRQTPILTVLLLPGRFIVAQLRTDTETLWSSVSPLQISALDYNDQRRKERRKREGSESDGQDRGHVMFAPAEMGQAILLLSNFVSKFHHIYLLKQFLKGK